MGANSARGFVSFFNEMYNENFKKVIIIKGGPGTGKSSLMKKIADTSGGIIERIYCSADPDSLDAVIWGDGKYCILDGTAPHVTDPKFPGVIDHIFDTGRFWDTYKLAANKEKIVEISRRKTKLFSQAYKFVNTAGIALHENCDIATKSIKQDKLNAYMEKLIDDEIPQTGGNGREKRRFLCAVTPKGIRCFYDTVGYLCDRIIVFEDEYSITHSIMKKICETAPERGHDIYSCHCGIQPEHIDHVIIPSLRTAFVSSNELHKYEGSAFRTVNTKNFIDTSELKANRAKFAFNKRSIREMLDEAVFKLSEAKELHGLLEEIYSDAMDFDAMNAAFEGFTIGSL